MGFWGHNFGSRHARRSSKGSIDADNCLVSKTSLSQNFGPWDWCPGRVKVGLKNENTPTLRASPRRTPHPNQKIFFLVEPRRLSASVEGLNTSLAAAGAELYPKLHEPLWWLARSLKGFKKPGPALNRSTLRSVLTQEKIVFGHGFIKTTLSTARLSSHFSEIILKQQGVMQVS